MSPAVDDTNQDILMEQPNERRRMAIESPYLNRRKVASRARSRCAMISRSGSMRTSRPPGEQGRASRRHS